jgi:hypothetical protein
MLSAVGGYVFPYIPPGITNPSAIGTSGGNGASWPLTGSDSAKRLIECFRGKPDGVELATDTSGGSFTPLGGGRYQKVAGSSATLSFNGNVLNSGDRAQLKFVVESVSGGSITPYISGLIQSAVTVPRSYSVEGVSGASTATDCSFYAPTDVACVISAVSCQKLNPATFTIGALCYMGAGSAELPNSASVNIKATDNSVNTLQARKDSGGNSYLSDSYEGTTGVNNLLGTWSRGEYHLKLVQSKSDGSQFRVGNKRIGIDSSIQWGAWVNFDGSFNPLTYLRLAYNGAVPLHIKGGFASDESLSDAEIEHQYNIIAR